MIKSREMRWAGHVAHMEGEERCIHGFSGERAEGKKPLERTSPRWEHNIKTGLQEVGGSWTGLIWLRRGTGGGNL